VKRLQIIFIAIVVALLLTPFVGMLWTRGDTAAENRSPAPLPSLTADGAPNISFASELGAWFDDHFAYRNEAVATNALLRYRLFGVSASSQVLVGSDGWLYYEGTLADWRGTVPMSERALFNAAHNMALLQRFSEAQGAEFLLTICPNKNTLYPEHMPSSYWPSLESSNLERLLPYLDALEVSYLDMSDALDAREPGALTPEAAGIDSWYFERDTHWNGLGAFVGFEALAERFELASLEGSWTSRVDHIGDLDKMLFGEAAAGELNWYLSGVNDGPGTSGASWSYTGEATSVDADRVITAGQGSETIVVYRDSFTDALMPYLAAATEEAVFSKLIPYNALEVSGVNASLVLVERAERHLDYLAAAPPIVPCPSVALDTNTATRASDGALAASTLEKGANGPLVTFSGVVAPELLATTSRVYVALVDNTGATTVFEALTSSPEETGADNGYMVYLSEQAIPEGMFTVNVYVESPSGLVLAQSESYKR
jgi:hypothetical protein